jgi:hypothetical protein
VVFLFVDSCQSVLSKVLFSGWSGLHYFFIYAILSESKDPIDMDEIKINLINGYEQMDETLNEIFDLDFGETADREFVGAK